MVKVVAFYLYPFWNDQQSFKSEFEEVFCTYRQYKKWKLDEDKKGLIIYMFLKSMQNQQKLINTCVMLFNKSTRKVTI